MKLLEINNLHTYFETRRGLIKAVNGVSLSIEEGKTLGVVGESGSGKSQTAMSILQLFEKNQKIYDGEIYFQGRLISKLSTNELYKIRGNSISMIFQEPMTSLNPVFNVRKQIAEVLLLHQKLPKREAYQKAVEMLAAVKIPNPEKVAKQYPHQLSGGMRQRVMIAMALACEPKILIADEPTTALDVTTQADIMELIRELQEKMGTSVILVTHDLGIAAEVGDRIQVMYAGEIIETGTKSEIFKKAVHPYTWALMKSVPSAQSQTEEKLYSLKGTPPDLIAPPKACAFAPRCEYCMGICRRLHPVMAAESESHSAGCWLMHPDAPKPEQLGKGGTI